MNRANKIVDSYREGDREVSRGESEIRGIEEWVYQQSISTKSNTYSTTHKIPTIFLFFNPQSNLWPTPKKIYSRSLATNSIRNSKLP
jgi:hypothetical protein